ncbi:MAG: hypothetical protein AAF944_10455 [Bacteroidota bacterium]
MKQLCLILTILMLSTASFGQPIGDSIVFYVDNRVEVNLAVPDYSDLKSSNDVVAALADFKRVVTQLKSQLSSESAEVVRHSVGGSVTVEPTDQKVTYLKKEGNFTNTGVRDSGIILGKEFKIFITTSDISSITDLSLSECLEKIVAILPEKSRWSTSLYYECIDGAVMKIDDRNNELDFLELTLGAGAGLVKNTWVPDVSFGVGIGFNKKGVARFPYISSNMLFDFDPEGSTNINTFLNVGYGWDLSKQTEKKEILGIELGYLISRQGGLFGENTFKFGANWSPVKGVFVNPHLYITDNFDTVFPGIRVGFGF